MEAVEPNFAAAGGANPAWERGLQAPRAGAMDGGARVTYDGDAQLLAGGAAYAADRDQAIPIHRRKFSSGRAQALERRPEAHAGLARRGARSRCAVGECDVVPCVSG